MVKEEPEGRLTSLLCQTISANPFPIWTWRADDIKPALPVRSAITPVMLPFVIEETCFEFLMGTDFRFALCEFGS